MGCLWCDVVDVTKDAKPAIGSSRGTMYAAGRSIRRSGATLEAIAARSVEEPKVPEDSDSGDNRHRNHNGSCRARQPDMTAPCG